MAKEYAKSFYNSARWERCRNGFIKSVDGLCQRCLAKGVYKRGKIVHHINYITGDNANDPEVLLSWDNLEYLCQDCHNAEHHGVKNVVEEGLRFDELGNLIKNKK